ncbi:lipopolysaccharide core heptose(I) kinase RfaP [Citrobacter sp. MGH110]|uniref:lipopolysaccharide core heptose(I) kinase RfaP n=1 Tax=Citrobacter sp. MGH110 TaxID=1686383 RepID=UPI0006510F2C|nr:lipopolysaccharide core heptose(I) kinase RfaP [Citrobacter sp. MGH110]KLV69374.1 lipopolysaccharide core heptose(I) kinase RfaP [Citrobacter sp. MGH110]
MIELKEPFATQWQGKDPFTEVTKLDGEVFRALETRRTLRFEMMGKGYFLKYHHGTTLKEVVKNLISLRMPVLGADREWLAIHRLKELNVDTMTGVAFGQKGLNPLERTSFIITEDLSPTISLEDFCAGWGVERPDFVLKRTIITRVAEMVGKMHRGGVNHRDCYICHFLLQQPMPENIADIKLSVIDLHRAQIRQHVPRRWRDKDLIGLYFSSLEIGLTSRDIYRFLRVYFSMPLREIFRQEVRLFEQAVTKAQKIRRRTIRKAL